MIIDTGNPNERKLQIDKEWIQKSYDEGHYVEAIILTHYMIEVLMNNTFDIYSELHNSKASFSRMERAGRFNPNSTPQQKIESLYLTSTYKYLTIAKILRDVCVYDNKLYPKLEKFNTYRNDVSHRLLIQMPTKKDMERKFNHGIELYDIIREKYIEMHQRKMQQSFQFLNELRKANEKKDSGTRPTQL